MNNENLRPGDHFSKQERMIWDVMVDFHEKIFKEHKSLLSEIDELRGKINLLYLCFVVLLITVAFLSYRSVFSKAATPTRTTTLPAKSATISTIPSSSNSIGQFLFEPPIQVPGVEFAPIDRLALHRQITDNPIPVQFLVTGYYLTFVPAHLRTTREFSLTHSPNGHPGFASLSPSLQLQNKCYQSLKNIKI